MTDARNTRSNGLLIWLILLTLAAVLCSVSAVVFGFLINMDTKIEMNPNGDPLARQDAIGFRLVAWGGVAVFILLLSAGVIGAWRERGRERPQRAFSLSLVAAVPMFLAASTFAWILVSNSP